MEKERLDRCIQWSKENGAIIDVAVDFHIDTHGGFLGELRSSGKINSLTHHKLISIPSDMLITKKLASNYLSEIDLTKDGSVNGITQLFVSKLKFDSKPESKEFLNTQKFFKPYLDILPVNLSHPFFWSNDELTILKGTDLFAIVKQELKSLLIEWKLLFESLKRKPHTDTLTVLLNENSDLDNDDFITQVFSYINESTKVLLKNYTTIYWDSFIAYVWAFCIFKSRAFPEILINPDDCENINQVFLLPIVDLLNHKNDTKVELTYSDKCVHFFSNTESFNNKNENPVNELFNNYADKFNEELLNYDLLKNTKLTFRLDEQSILNARRSGTNLKKEHLIVEGCVQFKISSQNILPTELLKLFGFLCKSKAEDGLTYRSMLQGSDELQGVLFSKLTSLKHLIKPIKGNNSDVKKILKTYLTSQIRILNQSIEALAQEQKKIIKKIKQQSAMISFKKLFNSDKVFANAMLLRFGVITFEDMITKNCLNQALMLWIVRVANKDSLSRKLEYQVPEFITETFEEVSSSIVVEKDKVLEYMSFYKNLFPHISEKIPDVFGQGNWGIKQFIIADAVIDSLVWISKSNQEPFFLLKWKFED